MLPPRPLAVLALATLLSGGVPSCRDKKTPPASTSTVAPTPATDDEGGLVASPLVALPVADRESLELLAKMSKSGTLNQRTFAALFQVASPSVVNIFTSRVVKRMTEDDAEEARSRYEQFFGYQAGENLSRSLGSGFIIDRKGYILTNFHVIENADEIRVRTSNGKEVEAKVVGRDAKTDLAILKIQASRELRPVVFGDSAKVNIGEYVAAIGNPFGLSHTMTVGIVSAKGRRSRPGEALADLIQTDATINPGNSGGPLLNLAGEVVGVNTSISALGKGIGFAIPINAVREIIAQLKLKGRVVRPWLGIYLQTVTPELASSFGLKVPRGALVSAVLEGSPSDKAGLKQGDIIVRWDGKELRDNDELRFIVHRAGVGRSVKLTVIRDMQRAELLLPLEPEPEEAPPEESAEAKAPRVLGLEVASPTEEVGSGGVVVQSVTPQSVAQEAGLRVDDLVLNINGAAITSVGSYQAEFAKLAPGDICRFRLRRRAVEQFIAFRVPPK